MKIASALIDSRGPAQHLPLEDQTVSRRKGEQRRERMQVEEEEEEEEERRRKARVWAKG